MFQMYQISQKNFYDTILKSVLEQGKISHAYLIETNGFPDSLNLATSFAKFLMCTSHKVEQNNCSDCNLCHLIDEGVCSDFKIIEPDGLWIKKEQLRTLQADFKTKSLDNNYRIYIINGADRLNKSAANSILKFLEEPQDNIIAILLTPNRYQVLNTIVSRCQLFRLVHYEEEKEEGKLKDLVFPFVNYIEEKGVKTIAYLSQIFPSSFKTKDQYMEFFLELQQYYEEMLKCKIGRELSPYYLSQIDVLKKQASNNSIDDIIHKIDSVYSVFEKIDYNANQSLIMDKLIIDLCGGAL